VSVYIKSASPRPGNGEMPTPLMLVLVVFLPFAAGYFLSFFYRVVNAVIATDLAADLGLSAGALGLLTSAYFLAFAAFQLPLGVMLDRYGARRIQAALLLVAAAGSLMFALSQEMPGLIAGRALIGIGVSAGLMASFKAFVQWFKPQRLPLINGCLLGFGGLGAITATAPVEFALGFVDWRTVFIWLAFVCVAVGMLIWRVVPERPVESASSSLGEQVAALGTVFRSAWFWRVAPLGAFTMGGTLALQGLWAGPWLRDVADLDRSGVAGVLLLIAVALTAGFVTWGLIAERLGRRGIDASWVVLAGVGMTLVCLLLLVLQPAGWEVPIWMLFAFCSTSGTLLYAVVSRSFDPSLAGRVNTAFNLLVFVGAFGLQWGLGLVIELWEGPQKQGNAPWGYAVAVALLAAAHLCAYVWFATGVLKHGRQAA